MSSNALLTNSNIPATYRETVAPGKLLRMPVLIGSTVIVLCFGGLGTWAATAPIAGATIASGVVSTDSSRQTVQHLEGGLITEILVDDGDMVQAGDRLFVLQETQARAAFEVLQGQRQLLGAMLARLLAEQSGQQEIRFPEWLQAPETDSNAQLQLREILQSQRELFTARNELHASRKAIGEKRIEQLGEEITGLESQIKSQREQIGYLSEELKAKKGLLDRGMMARPDYLSLLRERAEIEGDMAQLVASIARTRQNIGETELQIVNEDAVRLDRIVSELVDARSELDSIGERLFAQRDVLSRTIVLAPVSGVIMQKRFHTTGGVVGPGQPILDIVPQDEELLIDAKVRLVDIDDVAPMQAAQVHFLAYSERNLPQINGIVRSVSADSLLDEVSGASYYLARVEVPPKELAKLGEGVTITPGMPADVSIMTGERTMLQYLTQPLIDSLRHAFRES